MTGAGFVVLPALLTSDTDKDIGSPFPSNPPIQAADADRSGRGRHRRGGGGRKRAGRRVRVGGLFTVPAVATIRRRAIPSILSDSGCERMEGQPVAGELLAKVWLTFG